MVQVENRSHAPAGLMSLDEVAEAVGLSKGSVVGLLGHEFRRVSNSRRVYVPESDVIAYVKSQRYVPAGGGGPSEAYRWMIGESHAIALGQQQAEHLTSTVRGLSDEALREIFRDAQELRAIILRALPEPPSGTGQTA